MINILNKLFSILKYLMFIGVFAIVMYIIMGMNTRIEKSLTEYIDIFIPLGILLLVYIINIIFKQKQVTNNIFYNITSVFVFSAIIIVGLRTIFDKGMILNQELGFDINFVFFSDFIPTLIIMIYGLIIANIIFMINIKKHDNKKETSMELPEKTNEMTKTNQSTIEEEVL